MDGEQLGFFCKLERGPIRETIAEKWLKFHKSNPAVFEAIHREAVNQLQSGRRRISLKWIFEILRADPTLSTNGKPFKLNNTYTACYARELIRQDPRFENLIEIRDRE